MKPVEFVLALPRDPRFTTSAEIEIVPTYEDLLTARPCLWASAPALIRRAGSQACVIGHLFADDHIAPISIDSEAKTRLPTDRAAWLLTHYWGAYLALFRDPASGRWQGFTDPSGLFPVFRLMTRGHVLLASHPRLLERASGAALAIDWSALARHIRYPDLRQRTTCFAGIDELPPGTMLDLLSAEQPGIEVWNPGRFLPSTHPPSFAEAAEELAGRAMMVMNAWTTALGKVAVAVSGGVDSSFICAALARRDALFDCVTLLTADQSGDESGSARLLAAHLNKRLSEQVYQPERFNPHLSASRHLPRPSRRSFLTEVDRLLHDGADELSASIVLDGNAGDNLFCFLHSAAPAADHIRCEGLSIASARTILDMCRLTGADLTGLLGATIKKLRCCPATVAFAGDDRFLAPDAAEQGDVLPLVRWHEIEVGRHHGSRDHLRLIMRAQNHVHPATFPVSRLSPLMSQPILEYCLSVPTWLWPQGGINRALARRAFAPDLPPELLQRTSKSGPDSFIRLAFTHHRLALRNRLLGGILAHHGLLDEPAVDEGFTLRSDDPSDTIYRLLDLVEAENWARSCGG